MHCAHLTAQGYFSGSYNDIKGSLTLANGDHGEVSGSWSGVMNLKRTKHGEKEVLFDSNGAKPSPKLVAPESAQEEKESRRCVRAHTPQLTV